MAKWLEYIPKFTEEAARISYMGLLAILKCTRTDIDLGSLKVKKGGTYSEQP